MTASSMSSQQLGEQTLDCLAGVSVSLTGGPHLRPQRSQPRQPPVSGVTVAFSPKRTQHDCHTFLALRWNTLAALPSGVTCGPALGRARAHALTVSLAAATGMGSRPRPRGGSSGSPVELSEGRPGAGAHAESARGSPYSW